MKDQGILEILTQEKLGWCLFRRLMPSSIQGKSKIKDTHPTWSGESCKKYIMLP